MDLGDLVQVCLPYLRTVCRALFRIDFVSQSLAESISKG